MKVYDCMGFFNENDILEIRLNQHWDFVDKFVIVEAGETHTGIKKEYNFDHERFKPYMDKIVYRTFDSFDEARRQFPEYYDPKDDWVHDYHPDWFRDNFQANYLHKVLNDMGADEKDIVYMAPPDEMIKKSAMEEALERFKDPTVYDITDPSGRISVKGTRPIFHFAMDLYIYKFNLMAKHTPRELGSISEFGNYKKIFPALARNVQFLTHPAIKDAGWHFSYADPTAGERVLKKYHSWAHASDPGKGLEGTRRMDAETTDQALLILQREFEPFLVDITAETHPQYMVDNLDKFQDYIFTPVE
jgi:beta-1,4-mannosyl-glycoprotein beta-1,4-N-acetylglucosaminyltransferase